MKEIKLSRRKNSKYVGFVALVDDADYDWLSAYAWHVVKEGYTFYARTRINKKLIKMHRMILGLNDDTIITDHEDRNGLNCQRHNLRLCSHSENAANVLSYAGSTSRFLGVHWSKDELRWVASITKNKKKFRLGSYETETLAAIVYNQAAKTHHGKFARINLF